MSGFQVSGRQLARVDPIMVTFLSLQPPWYCRLFSFVPLENLGEGREHRAGARYLSCRDGPDDHLMLEIDAPRTPPKTLRSRNFDTNPPSAQERVAARVRNPSRVVEDPRSGGGRRKASAQVCIL